MPHAHRRSVVVSAVLSLVLLAAIALPAAAATPTPPGIDHFLQALSHVESGGRYAARNGRTGAYGKYQVMPSTWRGWARTYLGSSRARPTPGNQERLVRAAVASAYWRFGRWDVVAYWWLNGRAQRDAARWDRASRRYVAQVMAWFDRYGGMPAPAPAATATPSPTPTATPATPTAAPAASPSPTDPPSASPTPAPSDAPSPSVEPSAIPVPAGTTSPGPSPAP